MGKSIDFLQSIIGEILDNMSIPMREALSDMFDVLEQKARETKNPIDDILVRILRKIIGL